MKNSEIKELSLQELKDRLVETQQTLIKVQLGHSISPLENPLQIRHIRRDVARLQTELVKREFEA